MNRLVVLFPLVLACWSPVEPKTPDGGTGGATMTSTFPSTDGGGAVSTGSSGCAVLDGGTPPAVGSVMRLEFSSEGGLAPGSVLVGGVPSSYYPPQVHVVVTDAAKAQDAYAAILALPVFSQGTYACPFDFQVRYKLTFLFANGSLEVSANPSGCQVVSIPGTCARTTEDVVHAADSFWSEISQDLGVPESEIYPLEFASAFQPDGGEQIDQ